MKISLSKMFQICHSMESNALHIIYCCMRISFHLSFFEEQDQTRILLNKMYSIFNSLVDCFPYTKETKVNNSEQSSTCFPIIHIPTLVGCEEDKEQRTISMAMQKGSHSKLKTRSSSFFFIQKWK